MKTLKKLAFGTLVFSILMTILVGISILGWNLGWQHNNVFNAAMRGGMIGIVAGSFWATRELFRSR
jgi:hypothetical protein